MNAEVVNTNKDQPRPSISIIIPTTLNTNNQAPIPTTRPTTSVTKNDDTPLSSSEHPITAFKGVRIKISLWNIQMQDCGGSKGGMPNQTYLRELIPSFGPSSIYHHHISAIAIN